jgi:glycosyltransferase involved in cell wall biosynthesis
MNVIILTSNRVRKLELCLRQYALQTYKEFSVVVADDGSTDGTIHMLEKLKSDFPFPVKHVRQRKKGFRRPRIINEAVKASSDEYIFFTDCDCMPSENLLEIHAQKREHGTFLLGGAVRMSKDRSEKYLRTVRNNPSQTPHLLDRDLQKLRKQIAKAQSRLLKPELRGPRIFGANFSLYRDDFLAVNGYDENFVGWGNADGDLRERLKSIGVKPVTIYEEAIVFHLFHLMDTTVGLRQNKEYAHRTDVAAWCPNGIDKSFLHDESRIDLR